MSTARLETLKMLAATGLDSGRWQTTLLYESLRALQSRLPPAHRLGRMLIRQRALSSADRRFVALCGQVRETSR